MAARIYVGHNEKNGAAIVITPDGARETRSIRRLPAEQQWDGNALVNNKGLPWDYGGTRKRRRPLYTSARVPMLPDSATLEQVAKAAGTAVAEAIAAGTPKPNNNDEAGSDSPDSSSTSSSSSSASRAGPGGENEPMAVESMEEVNQGRVDKPAHERENPLLQVQSELG